MSIYNQQHSICHTFDGHSNLWSSKTELLPCHELDDDSSCSIDADVRIQYVFKSFPQSLTSTTAKTSLSALSTSLSSPSKSIAFKSDSISNITNIVHSAYRYYDNSNVSQFYSSNIPSDDINQLKPSVIIRKNLRNPLLDLWFSAHKHASTNDNILFLLVATSDYADLLTNFLCYTTYLHITNFLVITQDDVIMNIAMKFHIGFYVPSFDDYHDNIINHHHQDDYHDHVINHHHHQEDYHDVNRNYHDDDDSKSKKNDMSNAEFGSVNYQRLILRRTESALELLLMGYHPIIVDIDTVWKSNPMEYIPWSQHYHHGNYRDDNNDSSSSIDESITYDIAIVDDSGEVCGCFIALHYTEQSILFWRKVVLMHRELVSNAIHDARLSKFDESEQKILTRLIYKRQYDGALAVMALPPRMFPSGFTYFNTHMYIKDKYDEVVKHQHSHDNYSNSNHHDLIDNSNDASLHSDDDIRSIPAIIHNNFIVGRELKQARFQRYKLWKVTRRRGKNHYSTDCY